MQDNIIQIMHKVQINAHMHMCTQRPTQIALYTIVENSYIYRQISKESQTMTRAPQPGVSRLVTAQGY